LTTKCVVQRCDKSPTEPKHVCRVSSLTNNQGKCTWAYARLANQRAAQLSTDETSLPIPKAGPASLFEWNIPSHLRNVMYGDYFEGEYVHLSICRQAAGRASLLLAHLFLSMGARGHGCAFRGMMQRPLRRRSPGRIASRFPRVFSLALRRRRCAWLRFPRVFSLALRRRRCAWFGSKQGVGLSMEPCISITGANWRRVRL
jgi:hypothetical protein